MDKGVEHDGWMIYSLVAPHVSVVLGAIVESIAYVSANFAMTTRMGRRYTYIMYTLFTTACVLIIPFITDNHPIPTIIVSQFGKLAISGAVCVSWIYVPELFPTSIRVLSNAVLVFFGRFGAILAPIIDATTDNKSMKITFYVYSALSLITLIPVLFLPETRNQPLENVEESSNESHFNIRYRKKISVNPIKTIT